MSDFFVDLGQFCSQVLQLLIGIPLWIAMAILIIAACEVALGPVVGTIVAVIVILNYARR